MPIATNIHVHPFFVTCTAGDNGIVRTPGPSYLDEYSNLIGYVNEGTDAVFFISPNQGYGVLDVIVDEVSVGPVLNWEFSNIAEDHSISASFYACSWDFTVNLVGPESARWMVDEGAWKVSGEVISIPSGTHRVSYLNVDHWTSPIDEIVYLSQDESLDRVYISQYLTITSSSGSNGSISPLGSTLVAYEGSCTYLISPDVGYDSSVMVDGIDQGGIEEYTFDNVIDDHTISASFVRSALTIMSSSGDNGSIFPAGEISIAYEQSILFEISPVEGYRVEDVLVDGVSVGSVEQYAFLDVTINHTISATFSTWQYFTITPSVNDPLTGLIVAEAESNTVVQGGSIIYDVYAFPNFYVRDVTVDGERYICGRTITHYSYEFSNVQQNHTISAYFSNLLDIQFFLSLPMSLNLSSPSLSKIEETPVSSSFSMNLPTSPGLSSPSAVVFSSLGTATISIAVPGVVTKSSHGLIENDEISFSTTGVLPNPIAPGKSFFVHKLTDDTFNIMVVPDGSYVDTTGTSSGVHTLWKRAV